MHATGSGLELLGQPSVRVVDIRVRPVALAGAEHVVEVECRGASVGRQQRILWHTQLRGLIERDVVIGELDLGP